MFRIGMEPVKLLRRLDEFRARFHGGRQLAQQDQAGAGRFQIAGFPTVNGRLPHAEALRELLLRFAKLFAQS